MSACCSALWPQNQQSTKRTAAVVKVSVMFFFRLFSPALKQLPAFAHICMWRFACLLSARCQPSASGDMPSPLMSGHGSPTRLPG